MLEPGERIGPLRIERPLGAGGMGEVWLARDERLERLVAVKLLPDGARVDPGARGRMLREARAASALKHPNIVTIHDIGDHEGRAYIVMEYVEGETFEAVVKRRGALPAAEAVELLGQVADAVAVAHAAGILHRDLKAQNLMLDTAGRVKVLDFGLSKRTGAGDEPSVSSERWLASSSGGHPADAVTATGPTVAPDGATVAPDGATTPAPSLPSQSGRTDEPETAFGVRMGTPGWAPPELIDGRPSDVRADVFSLGVVLYHLLSGTMPFRGATWGELREQIDRGPAPPSAGMADVPAALDEVVLAALDPEPERRPQSVGALIDRARAALSPSALRPRRRRVAVAGTVAMAVGGGALVVWALGGPGARSGQPLAGAAPVDAAGGTDAAPVVPAPVRLTALGGCAYSPAFLDEETLSFDLTRDGTVDLYELRLGDSPVQLTRAPGWEWRSSRADEGRAVLYFEEAPDGLFVSRFDRASKTTSRVFASGGSAVQVGDGYFHAPSPGNVLRRRKESRDEPFLTLEAGAAIDTIAVSPDQRSLALLTFGDNQLARVCTTPVDRAALRCYDAMTGSARPSWSSTSDAVYMDGKLAIHRLRAASGEVDVAVPDVVATGGIAVSPAGRHLVYSDCITRAQIVELSAGGLGKPIVDEGEAKSPTFGPGGRFAFVGRSRNVFRVMVRESDGTLRELARHTDARITGLAFSKNGQWLAYVLGSRTEPGIYVTAVESAATPNRITEGEGDRDPLFVGDGLVFTRNDASGSPRLMRVSLDGSHTEMASTRPRQTVAVDHGRDRVLLASPALDFLYWWDPRTGAESAGPALPKDAGMTRISPGGTWLMFLEGANGKVTDRLRLDGKGKIEKVLELPGDQTAGPGAIDDDGRIAMTVHLWVGELWQVDAPAGSRW